MFWEQKSWDLDLSEHGFTPIDLCEQLDITGREALLEILVLNYRKETKKFIADIERFEKKNLQEKK